MITTIHIFLKFVFSGNAFLLILMICWGFQSYAQQRSEYNEWKFSGGMNIIPLINKTIHTEFNFKLNDHIGTSLTTGGTFKRSLTRLDYDYENATENNISGYFIKIGPRIFIPAEGDNNVCLYAGIDAGLSIMKHNLTVNIDHFYGEYIIEYSETKSTFGLTVPIGMNVLLFKNIRMVYGASASIFEKPGHPYLPHRYYIPGYGNNFRVITFSDKIDSSIQLLLFFTYSF